jgi:acetyl esterase/lipase
MSARFPLTPLQALRTIPRFASKLPALSMLKPTLKLMLRCFARPMLGPPVPLAVQRIWIVLLTRIMLNARGITASAETAGGVRCETLRPPSGGHERAILFLHGGAYVIGSPLTHRALTTHLAQFADATVLEIGRAHV